MKIRRLDDIYPALYKGANKLLDENPFPHEKNNNEEYLAYRQALEDFKEIVPEIVDGIPEPNYIMMVLDFLAAALIMIPNVIIRLPIYLAKFLHDKLKHR